MLHLYRRHRTACPHTSWTYRRCGCPIYVKGTLAGDFVKKSLDLTNWDAAQKLIGEWQTAGRIGQLVPEGSTTLTDAITAFLADLKDRNLSAATVGKYHVLLTSRLLAWAAREEGTNLLRTLTLDALSRFRSTWPDAPLARAKNQERLRAFFRWCVKRGWLASSPADDLSIVKYRVEPTLPFTEDEMVAILAAIDQYPLHNSYGHDNRVRLRAFVMALRWSGLRIRDVVTLTSDRVKDGKIRLYTQKTGQHVYVPIPPACSVALSALTPAKDFLFWSGNGLAKSAVADWQRSLRKLFALANVPTGHAHRFRDTFAVELLLKGVDLADVSILLGHSSIKITEKHYTAWVAARQHRIEKIVQETFVGASAPDDSLSTQHHTSQSQPVIEPEKHGENNARCEKILRFVRGRNPSRTSGKSADSLRMV